MSTKLPDFAGQAPLFAALGDESRLALVARLSQEGPQSITALAEPLPITRQAVTKHLTALAGAGLVTSRRVGREKIWQLEPQRLGEAERHLQTISRQWDEAIDRLRAFVEDA